MPADHASGDHGLGDDALAKLYFGKDDAESDIASGGLLRESFLPTATYRAVLGGRKSLVLGRKGSGKSAICAALRGGSPDGFAVSVVTPDEVSAEAIRTFELDGMSAERSKTLVWRYVFAVQTARFLVSHAAAAHRRTPDGVKRLRRFLHDNGEDENLASQQRFWKVAERLRMSFTVEAFGVRLGLDAGSSDGIRAGNQLDVLEEGLRVAAAELGCDERHDRLLILVDQIELIWSNDRGSDATVEGLLLASKHVAARLPATRCVVLLRSDIYELLQFAERDKFRGDETYIEWRRASLLDLVALRASASLGVPVPAGALWNGLFPRTVGGTDIRSYLVNHTLLRPRELIQLCNLCRDTAEKNGHRRIRAADVVEATDRYSGWKLQDLIAEYQVNYPFLADLLVLFQNSAFVVARDSLAGRLRAISRGLATRYPDLGPALTTDNVLDVLYAIGFLGVLRDGEAVYSYAARTAVGVDDAAFVIHPSFRPALRAESSIALRPYEAAGPEPDEHLSSDVEVRGGWGGYPHRFRVSAPDRLLELLSTHGEAVADAVESAGLPVEVRDELRRMLAAMRRDLTAGTRADGAELLGRAAAMAQAFRGTARQLAGPGPLAGPGVARLVRVLDGAAAELEDRRRLRTLLT